MLKEFIIKNKNQVGDIKMGMSREDTRKCFGNYKEFKKNKFSKNTSDKFNSFTIFYDENDKLEAVEFYNDSKLIFNSVNLFEQSYDKLKNILSKEDNQLNIDGNYTTSYKLNISLSSADNNIESILFFRDGYYD